MHAAARINRLDLVEEALSKRADVNAAAQKDGRPPLFVAVEHADLPVVECLLRAGASPGELADVTESARASNYYSSEQVL